MAATFQKFLGQANQVKTLADEARALRARLKQLVDHHNANGYSTANDASPPAYVNKDADGNIKGQLFAPADYLSFVNWAIQMENLFTNAAVTTADYKTTLEKIASA